MSKIISVVVTLDTPAEYDEDGNIIVAPTSDQVRLDPANQEIATLVEEAQNPVIQ